MGKKIPGRKHRGVKDPEKQAAIRLNSIKDKINAPPANPDEQEIPKALQKIIDFKNKVKSGDISLNRKKKAKKLQEESANWNDNKLLFKNKNKKHTPKPEKPVPNFKQLPGESDRQFLNRIHRICENVTREVAFEEKYGIEIRRNEAGKIEDVVKRPKDELDLLLKKTRKLKKNKLNKKKEKDSENEEPKLTKSQKWQKKKKERKLKNKLKTTDNLEVRIDQVKFGEIVHAPPTLVTPKKVEKPKNAPRPGKKNLLLKSIFERTDTKEKKTRVSKSEEILRKTGNKAINKKGKRRDLPTALRRQLDKQQKEIINSYRLLKAKKHGSS